MVGRIYEGPSIFRPHKPMIAHGEVGTVLMIGPERIPSFVAWLRKCLYHIVTQRKHIVESWDVFSLVCTD